MPLPVPTGVVIVVVVAPTVHRDLYGNGYPTFSTPTPTLTRTSAARPCLPPAAAHPRAAPLPAAHVPAPGVLRAGQRAAARRAPAAAPGGHGHSVQVGKRRVKPCSNLLNGFICLNLVSGTHLLAMVTAWEERVTVGVGALWHTSAIAAEILGQSIHAAYAAHRR